MPPGSSVRVRAGQPARMDRARRASAGPDRDARGKRHRRDVGRGGPGRVDGVDTGHPRRMRRRPGLLGCPERGRTGARRVPSACRGCMGCSDGGGARLCGTDRRLDSRQLLNWDVIDADVKKQLADRLAGWSEKYPGIDVQHAVSHDRPSPGGDVRERGEPPNRDFRPWRRSRPVGIVCVSQPVIEAARAGGIVLPASADPGPSTIRVTIRGVSNAVLVLEGTVSAEVTRRMQVMVSAILEVGVRRVIVDLSAASGVSAYLSDALTASAAELVGRGGWLLVEGEDFPSESLVDAFRAYRDAVSPALAPVGAGEVG